MVNQRNVNPREGRNPNLMLESDEAEDDFSSIEEEE